MREMRDELIHWIGRLDFEGTQRRAVREKAAWGEFSAGKPVEARRAAYEASPLRSEN